ncbi:hypothetical protein [Bacillus tropicus]|uniref:hypothetical protein n=1 Tax=Bacillus tropicus TaxID=2026188 RepID=UPI002DB76441|nr:hypothetical protein [Bacillus tropicus]MEC2921367.1 hypothetical protein [Bacillus tropicus]MEC2926606.1 hypothetical protein [Bacillus tropicus]MEC2956198.1 hypothetical protein [Bacillus tropicus]MEC3051502.1 hypothetical protein [Bacillus tropicus]MEC3078092.1 hypothetical protein [Bacillus tropicus]
MKFFKVCHKKNMRVIYSRSSYETVGYYLMGTSHNCNCMEYLNVQKLSTSKQIKVIHNGYVVLRTLQDICNKRKFTIILCTLVQILWLLLGMIIVKGF